MRSIIKNKKGDMPSLLIALVVIVSIIAIIGLIGLKVVKSIIPVAQDAFGSNANAASAISMIDNSAAPLIDNLIFFSFIGIIIGLIVSSYFIPASPVVVGIFIVMLVVITFIGIIFAHVYEDISATPTLQTESFMLPKTHFIFGSNYPLLILGAGVITLVILYGKRKGATEV